MSAHVLFNLLHELGKSDKMRGLPSILSLFRNKFDKFNNTGVRTVDSIYHMTLRYFCNRVFCLKPPIFCHLFCNVIMGVIPLRY